MPSQVIEIGIEDFKKRRFDQFFSDIQHEPLMIPSDDELFESYLQSIKWSQFKRDIRTKVLSEKFLKVKNNDSVFNQKQISQAKIPQVVYLSEKERIMRSMQLANNRASNFIKENIKLPLIMNFKKKTALYDVFDKKKTKLTREKTLS